MAESKHYKPMNDIKFGLREVGKLLLLVALLILFQVKLNPNLYRHLLSDANKAAETEYASGIGPIPPGQ